MSLSLQDKERKDLTRDVLKFIEAGSDSEIPEDIFNEYALRIFRYQYDINPVYKEFCDLKDVKPASVDRWEDIPLVYNDAFKTHLIVSFPVEKSVMACLTGGTTSLTQRGRIFRDEDGKRLVFTANRIMTGSYLFPDFEKGQRCRILILAPSPKLAPSMGMAIGMEQTRQHFGTKDSMFLLGRSGIHINKLLKALKESEETGIPVALIGATVAFVYFFQACQRKGIKFSLPQGSRICDGGGYRGRFGKVTRDDYYEMVEKILGIPWTHCVNVLGEAETATNLFDDSLRMYVKGLPTTRVRKRPVPPWCKVKALSIEDLSPLPDGEVGLLAHWDLANIPTVLGVITDNLGYTIDNGKACEMVGRAKLEGGKVSPLPDESAGSPMGDSMIFRMLERYVNFTIELKMALAQDPHRKKAVRFATPLEDEPSVREEVEARSGSLPSCPQVIDEILVSQSDREAAELRDQSLAVFKEQSKRPIKLYKQKIATHYNKN